MTLFPISHLRIRLTLIAALAVLPSFVLRSTSRWRRGVGSQRGICDQPINTFEQAMQGLQRPSEKLYQVPFEQAPHPSWFYDIETLRFVEVNRAACEGYGYTRDEFLQMTPLDICLPDDVPHLLESVRLVDSTANAPQTRWTHRKKDGTLIGVEMSSMLVTIQGQRLGLVMAHDVSERTMLEEQLRQSQKMEAVGRLAAGVVHDFNNLLTAILCYSTLALEKMEAHHPARADVREICAAGERAAGLIQQLLMFGRHHVPQQQVLNLNDVVMRSESLLKRVIGEDVSLVPLLDPDVDCIRADACQIEQIIMNLAINARDAMPEGGRLIFETQNVDLSQADPARHGAMCGAHVMLAITDTGTGMTEETRSHMFEPFFTTKETGKGTGLGLATVYGIVSRSGGSIEALSEVGHGTSIRVYFPSDGKSVKSEGALDTRVPSEFGSERVLLGEDKALGGSVRDVAAGALSPNRLLRPRTSGRPSRGHRI